MSGFSNEQGGGGSGRYANFKDGKIVTKIEGERKEFTHLEGDLIDVFITDETYENKPYRKLNLAIVHEDGVTLLGFPFGSGYGRSFVKILPNVDETMPIKISGTVKAIPNSKKKYGTVFIEQAGKTLKHYFTKDNEAGKKIPPVKITKVGKGTSAQEVKDFSDQDDFFEKVIVKKLLKIQKQFPGGYEAFKKASGIVPKKTEDEGEVGDDGLPF